MEFFSEFHVVSVFQGFFRSLTKYLKCCYIIDQMLRSWALQSASSEPKPKSFQVSEQQVRDEV